MTNLTFGEKLEMAFFKSEKSTKTIGKHPVSFCELLVDGVLVEVVRSVSHPWFWKLTNKNTGSVNTIQDKWGLCYVEKVQ